MGCKHHHPLLRETHSKPDQAGGTKPGARNTTTRRPKPAARAAVPQEPEPQPRKLRPGRTPEGQAPDGRMSSNPEEPGDTDRAQAADRRARAATGPAHANRGEDAEKTNSDLDPVKNSRTTASTPAAQPTETRHPETGTKGRMAFRDAIALSEGEREPEKPTERTLVKSEYMN
ncbi:MAG: hypothetical protein PUP91_37925 [Rhizonema sp. PD37]|nr:hypothetical protein [Rhizonema sp. PD37]